MQHVRPSGSVKSSWLRFFGFQTVAGERLRAFGGSGRQCRWSGPLLYPIYEKVCGHAEFFRYTSGIR